ncbi:MAG TPA: FHA domain-containing serine/threonine-protein kinase [Fimbriiglobus sp.]
MGTASGDGRAPKWNGACPWQLGRYRIELKIGEGGMGAVYRAFDEQLARHVALKIPFLSEGVNDPQYHRFLREGRAAAGLRHPNICPIFDLGQIDGVPFLSMAFIRGELLSRRVAPGRPLAERDAADVVRKIALAMAEAHGHQVIHRDLKPVNVMMDEAGEPIILDFGLARREGSNSHLTIQGQVMGTPGYMAPEQLNGDVDQMGPCSDVYSLGVIFYELLCGRPPFQGDMIALASQVMCDPPPPMRLRRPGIDAKLETICFKALEKKPEYRWPSMRDFAASVADWLDEPKQYRPRRENITTHNGTERQVDQLFLTLKVEGTPHAYRTAPRQATVSVGRQRRRPKDPDDTGNDFVVRVADNDALSARISRRHLEIVRTATGFAVTDHSKAGTIHNGRLLPPGQPVPLAHGDRLVIADVITLIVELDDQIRLVPMVGEVAVPVGPEQTGGKIVLEASVGDMMTVG